MSTNQALEQRLEKLEEWRQQEDVRRAEGDMRVQHIDEKFAELKKDIESKIDTVNSNVDDMNNVIKSSFTWLVRTVLGAGIVAFIGFALAGGGLAPFTGG